MSKDEFLKLLEKVESGTATLEELAAYNHIYKNFQTKLQWNFKEMGDQEKVGRQMRENIEKVIFRSTGTTGYHLMIRYAAAAVAVIAITVGLYFFNRESLPLSGKKYAGVSSDIPAGGNKATLTLANGTKISLTDAANGELLDQAGIEISKSADGQLVYELKGNSESNASNDFHTISTPNGGQYQILLSDGSKVWLNSASSLRFPAEFEGKDRNVELTGEAYFEIAKRKKMPFHVITNGVKVEVLGTHFNVMAYREGGGVKTTLLEGAVKLNSRQATTLLKPGQQGLATATGSFDVSEADIRSVMAWKNGYFMFSNSNLPEVMQQLSRWYDIDVIMNDKEKEYEFVGEISKTYSLSKVLKILELSDIKFELKGRTLIVK